jgi:excisionase family DNA binding protein
MKNPKFLSVPEAARRLGCSLKFIYDLTYAGKLGAEKVAGRWRIPFAKVEARRRKRAQQ